VSRTKVVAEFMIAMHDAGVPFTVHNELGPRGHVGYVAGRYRDGAYSDLWTDVRRCAWRTFTDYAPACSCGWQGPARPITDTTYLACSRDWACDHASVLQDEAADRVVDGSLRAERLTRGPSHDAGGRTLALLDSRLVARWRAQPPSDS